MALPVTFATLPTGNNLAALLDQDFSAVANMGTTYCTATGTNNFLLTVAPNQPNPTSYAPGDRYNFIAPATNTGPATIQVGGLAAIPIHSGGQPLSPNAIIAGTICEVVVGSGGTAADLPSGGGGGSSASTGDTFVYATKFGAVFDGNSHPLSNYYATLAAAQVAYPKATSLTNEIDGIATQAAIDFCAARASGSAHEYSYGGTVVLPNAKGLMNTPLAIITSATSLTVHGQGFMLRSLSRLLQTASCHLKWTGPAIATGNSCLYMLSIHPDPADPNGRMIAGSNVSGILFDCNQVTGVGGVLLQSVWHCRFDLAVNETRGVPYAATLTAGSDSITVPSTTNIHVGETITSPSALPGIYVRSIIDGVTIQASANSPVSSSETLVIGGECVRVDTMGGIGDSNDSAYNDFWIITNNELGAAYTYGPGVVLGGTAATGGHSGTTFGNTSNNTFHSIFTNALHGVGTVFNNTDHNVIDLLGHNALGGDSFTMVSNGSKDPNNGASRYNWFKLLGGNTCRFKGLDAGGWGQASIFNRIDMLVTGNGASIAEVGQGASVSVAGDVTSTLRVPYNNTQAIIPYLADSTTMGGNARGNYAVDLQTGRTAATQVASGINSAIVSGLSNTASGQQAFVGAGASNLASALASCVPGGNNNIASGSFSFAMGNGALAELYGMFAYSTGKVASGRTGQYGMQQLKAITAANTTPVRLTADGAAPGAANTVNLIATNQANILEINLIAIDSTATANRYAWSQNGMLSRAGGAGTVVYTPGTPTILAAGTTAGIAITEAADTTNGGYSLTFTPPTGNVVVWRVVATVTWTRVDGS